MRSVLLVVMLAVCCVLWECTASDDDKSSSTGSEGSHAASLPPSGPTTGSGSTQRNDVHEPSTNLKLNDASHSDKLPGDPGVGAEDTHGSSRLSSSVSNPDVVNGDVDVPAGSLPSTGSGINPPASDHVDADASSEEDDDDDDDDITHKDHSDGRNQASSDKNGAGNHGTGTGGDPTSIPPGSTALSSRPDGDNSGKEEKPADGSTSTHTGTGSLPDVKHDDSNTGNNTRSGTNSVTRGDAFLGSATGKTENTGKSGNTPSGDGVSSGSPGSKTNDVNKDQSQEYTARQATLGTLHHPVKGERSQTSSELSVSAKQTPKNKVAPGSISHGKNGKDTATQEDVHQKSDQANKHKQQKHDQGTLSKPANTKPTTGVSTNKGSRDILKTEPFGTKGNGVTKYSMTTTTTQMAEDIAPTEHANNTSTGPTTLLKKPIKGLQQMQTVNITDGSNCISLLLVFGLFATLGVTAVTPAY